MLIPRTKIYGRRYIGQPRMVIFNILVLFFLNKIKSNHFLLPGTSKATELLIKNGAAINALDKDGDSPLNAAVSFGWYFMNFL